MDRDDDDQEGITLPPTSTTRLLARDEADKAIMRHLHLCPFSVDTVNVRVRKLETSFARLIGFMIGSGLLGGVAGSIVAKIMK
jgi:hypothetical protein